MSGAMQSRVFAVLAILGSTAGTACLDPDPLPWASADASADGGGVLRDVSSDVDPRELCMACVRAPMDPGPGCSEPYANCVSVEHCLFLLECGTQLGCAAKPDQAAVLSCGVPCALDAGIFDPAAPAIQAVTQVIGCIVGICRPACPVEP